jgi:DNA (cytosine-5)-methyltransferase 1
VRYASLCDGIGAVHCAWQPLGWECAWTSEIDRFPIAVVDLRWGFRNLGDMTEITGDMIDEHGRLDLLVGGTPCQSFSVAGLRGGLDDARGNLALRFMQLCAAARPRWVVWENVPGVLSVDGGRAFGSILGALEELGYGWAYRTLDAQWFGVAQRRRRVFVVGHLGDWRRAAAVLFEQQSVRGDPATREAAKSRAASIAGRGAAGASWPAEVSCCINSFFGDKHGQDDQHIDDGGPMFVPGRGAAGASWWDGGQLSQTLDAVLSKGQTMPEKNRFPAVLEPVAHTSDGGFASTDSFQGGSQQDQILGEDAVCPALCHSSNGNKGHHQPKVIVPYTKAKRAQSASDDESWKHGEVSPTLNHFDVGDTAFSVREDAKAGNFSATPTDVGLAVQAHQPSVQSHHAQIFVAQPMAVRRLTPRECERLQGFPDDYTLIPWRKKPAEDCPDGPRYRALGNSMAVPVMRWIGERIEAVDRIPNASSGEPHVH